MIATFSNNCHGEALDICYVSHTVTFNMRHPTYVLSMITSEVNSLKICIQSAIEFCLLRQTTLHN